jgi:hypothetical protein
MNDIRSGLVTWCPLESVFATSVTSHQIKSHGIRGFLVETDQLESLFGILHTMVGNDANLDILQLSLHITSTTEVLSILAKHPEWDKGLHRLHLPTVSKSFDKLTNSVDHIAPRAYQCPEKLYPSTLMLVTS